MKTATSLAEVLRQEFHANYGNGRDFEGATLIEQAVEAGRLLEDIFGLDAAAAGMNAIAHQIGLSPDGAAWPQVFEEAWGEAYTWPMGEVFHNLNAYANFGFILDGGLTSDKREAALAALIEKARAFIAKAAPLDPAAITLGDVGHTFRLAIGRWALDHDETIDPATLACFGKVTERRIRNLMAGRERVFTPIEGRVPAKEALAWLKSRKSFRPSVWRDQDAFEDLAPRMPMELDAFVFAPAARDGSIFHPGLARDGRFGVGPTEAETFFDSYEEALAALQRQAEPVWRRPTPLGSWVSVTGVRWERVTPDDLERAAAPTA